MREKDLHARLDKIDELLGIQLPGRKKKSTQLDRIEKKVDKALAILKALPTGGDDPRLAEATDAVTRHTDKLKEAIDINTDPAPDVPPVP
jgi:hypothetical protein